MALGSGQSRKVHVEGAEPIRFRSADNQSEVQTTLSFLTDLGLSQAAHKLGLRLGRWT